MNQQEITRAEAIATAKTVMSAISVNLPHGVNTEKFTQLCNELIASKFVEIKTDLDINHQQAHKLYLEATGDSPDHVLVMMHEKEAREISSFELFDYYLFANELKGERFFIWYPNINEAFKRLPGQVSSTDEEAIRKAAETNPQTCC